VETIPVDDAIVKQLRVAETQPGVTRVVIDIKQAVATSTSQLTNPNRLIVEVKAQGAKPKTQDSKTPDDEKRIPAVVSSVVSGVVSGGRSLSDPSAAKSESKPLKSEVKTDAYKTELIKTDSGKLVATKVESEVKADVKTKSDAKPPSEARSKSDGKTKLDADAKSKPPVELASAKESSRPVPLAKVASLNSSANSSQNPSLSPAALPASTGSANLDSAVSPRSDATPDKVSLASLPPEPLGIEPSPSTPALDDLKKNDVKNDVKEILPAKRGSFGDRSLTRALGLKLGRIVIDPGHGGNDVGTHGPSGYYEKELTLDVSRRLAAVIRENMGSDVVLTRSDDEYVGLEERTRLANEKKADLFVSVHANSSPYRAAAGVETYVLSFTTSRTAMELASRENASSELGIHDLHDLLQKIALRDKVDESQELAARLQTSLSTLSTTSNKAAINRGVKKAPFVVLIGANMPSVLAEIGFLTNSADESLLRKPEHRQKIAEALYKGIANYADTLSQVVARKN
jgi:N-acetylmuramoyl-L-alanine amidase